MSGDWLIGNFPAMRRVWDGLRAPVNRHRPWVFPHRRRGRAWKRSSIRGTRNFRTLGQLAARRVAGPLVSPLVSSLAFAQDDLDETVVTATRTPVALDAVGASSSSSRATTSSVPSPATSANCWKRRPAWKSRATAAWVKPPRLFTRGTESNDTVVLIDGVRINPGTIGGAASRTSRLNRSSASTLFRARGLLYMAPMPMAASAVVHARRGKGRCERRRHVWQRQHAAGIRRCGADAGREDAAGFGGSYAEGDGTPVFVDDNRIRLSPCYWPRISNTRQPTR